MTYCVDSQAVILLNGQTANVELNYEENGDYFEVTADCDNWAESYRSLCEEYYPDDNPEYAIADAKADCKEISGIYDTLKEINEQLEKYCNPGDWYEFTWEYEDGTPVE